MTTVTINGICSMATRGLLAELAEVHSRIAGVRVDFIAVGGVEAARRVAAGESFDVVALASDAIDKLVATGALCAEGKVDLVRSGVGVAVREGAETLDISTADALRRAVLDAASIGYSTGPSGTALMALFARWGIADRIDGKLVQAPPGIAVGSLVARGEAALGFQQMSELIGVDGIRLLGPLPQAIQISTVFSGAPTSGCKNRPAADALLAFIASSSAADAVRRHGMEPI